MRVMINIGLYVADATRNTLESLQARADVANAYIGSMYSQPKIVQSGSEPTAVCTSRVYDMPSFLNTVNTLAHALCQDCIAVAVLDDDGACTGEGWLIGPKAEDWQPFNIEYFVTGAAA